MFVKWCQRDDHCFEQVQDECSEFTDEFVDTKWYFLDSSSVDEAIPASNADGGTRFCGCERMNSLSKSFRRGTLSNCLSDNVRPSVLLLLVSIEVDCC